MSHQRKETNREILAKNRTEKRQTYRTKHWTNQLKGENIKFKQALETFSTAITQIMASRFAKLSSYNDAAGSPYNSYDLGYHAALQEIQLRIDEAINNKQEILNTPNHKFWWDEELKNKQSHAYADVNGSIDWETSNKLGET